MAAKIADIHWCRADYCRPAAKPGSPGRSDENYPDSHWRLDWDLRFLELPNRAECPVQCSNLNNTPPERLRLSEK
jgi:hypothetical protein